MHNPVYLYSVPFSGLSALAGIALLYRVATSENKHALPFPHLLWTAILCILTQLLIMLRSVMLYLSDSPSLFNDVSYFISLALGRVSILMIVLVATKILATFSVLMENISHVTLARLHRFWLVSFVLACIAPLLWWVA
ncbi:hypothetical protein HDU91_003160, partial [Kappamyces sp. JEL0680]